DQQRVAAAQARGVQPVGEAALPALVVDAGGQLRDVVRGGVSLQAAQLAEVVDGVAGVPGRAADAEDEQPAAPLAQRGQFDRQPLQGRAVHALEKAARLVEVKGREGAHREYPALSLSPLNIRTVSRLNSTRSLPSRCSFERMASVTVMMS